MASVRAPTDSLNDSVMDGVSLCIGVSLGFVAKPQAQMAYCRWEYTRLKYIILSAFIYLKSLFSSFEMRVYPSLDYDLSAFQDILLS